MINRALLLASAGAVLLVLVFGIQFFFPPKTLLELAQRDVDNLDLYVAGNKFEILSNNEIDLIGKARYMILAGWSYNSAGDYVFGIPILKNIVTDNSLPVDVRTEAVIALGSVSYHINVARAHDVLFNDDESSSPLFKSTASTSIPIIVSDFHKLFVSADQLHQYSFTKYALSSVHVFALLNLELNKEQQLSTLESIKTLVKTGDYLFAEEKQSGLYEAESINILRTQAPLIMHLRLLAQEAVARFEDDDRGRKNIDDYYKTVIDTFDSYDTPALQSAETLVRFNYAIYLYDVYGEKRADDVRDALWPLYQYGSIQEETFSRYLATIPNLPKKERGRLEQALTNLTKIDRNFADYMQVNVLSIPR